MRLDHYLRYEDGHHHIISGPYVLDPGFYYNPPSDIVSSSEVIQSDLQQGSLVAELSSIDPDNENTFTYSLVDGDGSDDNQSFVIDGNQLFLVDSSNILSKPSYSIRVQSKDPMGLACQRVIIFDVDELDDNFSPLSLADVSSGENILTFKFLEPIILFRHGIDTVIVGTKKKDKITGTSEGEVLAGMRGKNVLEGGEGSDGFLFNQPGGFGGRHLDKIKDFSPQEGDSILLDKNVYGLGKQIKLKSCGSKNKVKKAAKSKNDFVYDDKKGLLYFNENGKKKGWGDGGLFAKLQGAPELGADDFTIV